MIKSGYFRAVEYKATSSKNFKERKDQWLPTQQPIILESLTNTEPTGISIKFAGIAEAVRPLCRWPMGSTGF